MVAGSERFFGNILFYEFLRRNRNPTFLSRNWEQAQQQHLQAAFQAYPDQDLCTRGHRVQWKPPSEKILHKMVQDHEGERAFVIETYGIESARSHRKARHRAAKTGLLFRLEVDVHITFIDTGSNKVVHSLSNKRTKMLGTYTDHGVKVTFDSPRHTTKLADLQFPRGSTTPTDWKLLISINFLRETDAEDFYFHMKPPRSPLRKISSTRLESQWPSIQGCPEKDKVLPLAARDGPALDLGLKVRMFWTAPNDESILTAYNRQHLQISRESSHSSIPNEQPRFKLEYIYQDETLSRTGLFCPHCTERTFQQLDSLRMHLDHFHELFRYCFKKGQLKNGIQHCRFICELADYTADRPRASNTVRDPREIELVAPNEPFNREKYLDEGDNSFQQAAWLEKGTRSAAAGPKSKSSAPLPRVPIHPKKPEDVKDMPPLEKKKYIVPEAPPGVTFVSAKTKRPLKTGEYVDESDDEVDMSWLIQRKNAHIDADPSIPAPAKRFLKIYDPFMMAENLHSEVHVGDAIMRLVRSKAEDFHREDVTDEIDTKLDQLLQDGIITHEIYTAAKEIVHRYEPAEVTPPMKLATPVASESGESPRSDTPRLSNKAKGKAKATDFEQITPGIDPDGDIAMGDVPRPLPTPTSPVTESPPFDLCVCNEDALTFAHDREIIVCDAIDCIRYAFHIECIVDAWDLATPPDRNSKWICKDCSAMS